MEIFNYGDWRAEGRRKAKAIGTPDLSTEQVYLKFYLNEVLVIYSVDLKTTHFEVVVEEFTGKQFSTRFMNMLEVSEEA